MWKFIRRWSWEIATVALTVSALGVGLSMTTNRQLAYAPCLGKVMAALRLDPAAAKWTKISSEPVQAQPTDCAMAEDVARDTHRVIADLLSSDPALFNRLPMLLADAGMECNADDLSIVCDCKAAGPFAIANPCADCQSLINLPLPFKRALFVAVNKRTGIRKGKTVQLGRYVVEVSYATALFETKRPLPSSIMSAQVSNEIIDRAYEW